MAESTITGEPFHEHDLLIARLDQLSRKMSGIDKLRSARIGTWSSSTKPTSSAHSWFGQRTEATKRYGWDKVMGDRDAQPAADDGHAAQRQGRGLSSCGSPARRRPFLREIPRRVAAGGRQRHHAAHGEGGLVKFDGTRLFPERGPRPWATSSHRPRRSSTSDVTATSGRDGQGRPARRQEGHGGFALTITAPTGVLSPDAIAQSLRRRGKSLQRLEESSEDERAPARRIPGGKPRDRPEEDYDDLRCMDEELTAEELRARSRRRWSMRRPPPRPSPSCGSEIAHA
jgi:hypothetical protein